MTTEGEAGGPMRLWGCLGGSAVHAPPLPPWGHEATAPPGPHGTGFQAPEFQKECEGQTSGEESSKVQGEDSLA